MGYINVAWRTPAKPVDCIECRALDWVSATHKMLPQIGSACATATSPATRLCELESGVRSGVGGISWPCISTGLTCSRNVLATTQADTVDLANSAATVKTMLAAIDTEQHAVFLAMATGKELSC